MRNKKGQFTKGSSCRPQRPYWDKDWLYNEYVNKFKSAQKIANEQGCKENNILHFIKKHNIKTRSMREIRNKKYWGLHGSANPMYGKTGKDNPNWDGGKSPERQSKYARSAWKDLAKSILKRDNYQCRKCNTPHTTKRKLVVHHINKWSQYPELRFNVENLITLCEKCHRKIHSRR